MSEKTMKEQLGVRPGDIGNACRDLNVSRSFVSELLRGLKNPNTPTSGKVINYFKQLKRLRNNLKEA